MKKRTGIRKAILVLVLAIAMIMGTMSLTAFADDPVVPTTAETTLISKLHYGKSVDFGTNVEKVTEPNGTEVTSGLNEYTPLQIGAYTVYLTGGYSYVVPCVLDKEYELRVENDGAGVPTYMTTGGEFVLPRAAVWFKSEKWGVDYEKSDDTVKYEIIGNYTGDKKTGTVGVDEIKIKLDNPGTYTVHYYSRVKGEGTQEGTKYLFKDYTVKVQKDFEDKVAPTLNVVSMPSQISLNTKVTLPKATATDNYDQNVRIDVKVSEYDEASGIYVPVKEVDVDDNGYATRDSEKTYNEVVFDNVYNLSFYPTVKTKYRVEYTATDDAGKTNTGVHVYTTDAVDKTAPVLKEIDDATIPTKWGITKVTRGKNDADTDDSETHDTPTTVTFPYPEYVDNNSKDLTVIFEIKDTVNNNTVVKFSNIYDASEDGAGRKYTYDANKASNGLYNNGDTPLEFTKDGLEIDFTKYTEHENLSGKAHTGTYTVSYQARDNIPNISTKTFDITLEDSFTDTVAPDVKVEFDNDYLLFTEDETEFSIPEVTVSDDNDSRPAVSFKLFAGEDVTDVEGKFIEVKGGETVYLKLVDSKPVLTVKKENGTEKAKLEFGDETVMCYQITATDDAGNVKVVDSTANINVINTETMLDSANAPAAPTFAPGADASLTQGKEGKVGKYTFAVAKEKRDYYGFEMSLMQNGKTVNTPVKFLTYYDGANVVVEDIRFAAPKAGTITLYFRVFNIAGLSKVEAKEFTVDPASSNQNPIESAVDINTTGTAYAEYRLKNRSVNQPDGIKDGRLYVVREITANGKFSLMRDTFVAYNAGDFKFADGYFNKDDEFTAFDKNPTYSMSVTETVTPAWQIQGHMPTYTQIGEATFNDSGTGDVVDETAKNLVTLPHVVATSDYANARVDVAVVGPDGALKVQQPTDTDGKGKDVRLNANGQYQFFAKKDGVYTVTLTAYYGDNNKISQSFEIKAGDIVAPTFTLAAEHDTRALEGNTFTFKEIKVESEEDLTSAAMANTNYTKRLKAPDGTVVYEVSGKGETKRTAATPTDGSKYTLNKVGTYTVEYTVKDNAGNESIKTYTISVSAKKVNNPVSTKIISTILIIVGVLLIAGVILYFVRFRKVKSK